MDIASACTGSEFFRHNGITRTTIVHKTRERNIRPMGSLVLDTLVKYKALPHQLVFFLFSTLHKLHGNLVFAVLFFLHTYRIDEYAGFTAPDRGSR
jgi:hypothetical protein